MLSDGEKRDLVARARQQVGGIQDKSMRERLIADLADALEASLTAPDGDVREALVEQAARACFAANNSNAWDAEDWDADWLSDDTREVWRNYGRAVLTAFPVLSRDIAGEIEAEAQAVVNMDEGSPHYRAGLERAAEIARGV